MRCPYCSHQEDKVVDSRESRCGDSTRRRRECANCGKRFTTYERIEEIPLLVVKKDGKRELFDRSKILAGMVQACHKRPVPVDTLNQIVEEIAGLFTEGSEREVPATEIGEKVMARLQQIDKVAYVRFASVYREFKDVNEFLKEIGSIFENKA